MAQTLVLCKLAREAPTVAEYPHMPLFVDAYLADTTHLSTTEHGAYMLLLMAAWRRPGCNLPDDDAKLAKIVRQPLANWLHRVRPVMAEFFQIEDGTWRQKRQTAIRNHVAAVSEKRRDAALSGVRARRPANPLPPQEPGPANAGANGSATEVHTVPTRVRNPNLNPKGESYTQETESYEAPRALPEPPLPDAVAPVWKGLAAAGVPRSLIGRWCRDYGDGSVVEAYQAYRRATLDGERADPRTYVIATLNGLVGKRGSDRSPMAIYQRTQTRLDAAEQFRPPNEARVMALLADMNPEGRA